MHKRKGSVSGGKDTVKKAKDAHSKAIDDCSAADAPVDVSSGYPAARTTSSNSDSTVSENAKAVDINATAGEVQRPTTPSDYEWRPTPPPATAEFPENLGISADLVAEYNQTLAKRIVAFMTYEKDATNTYAVNRMPAGSWGTDRPLDNKSNVWCRTGTNDPMLLWIVGKVSQLWFFDNNGDHAAQVSVHVVPLSDNVTIFSQKKVADLSQPRFGSVLDSGRDVRASRWQNLRAPGQRSGGIKPFQHVFDATDLYSGKHDMDKYPVEKLGLKDLVLIEVNLSRYRLREDDAAKSGASSKKQWQKPTWTKWRAQYELVAISLLHKARVSNEDGNNTATDDHI